MRARVAVACGMSPQAVDDLTGAEYGALVRVLLERTERN